MQLLLLALVLEKVALADGSEQRCFEDVVPLASDRTIKFFLNNWPGHELSTTVAAILVREKLGFPTEIDR